jgi:hypothetical protein
MLRSRVACLEALLAAWTFALLAATAAAAEEGWTDLLPGGDFSKHWQTKGNWIADTEAGVVRLQPRPGEKGWTRYDMYLWSTRQYKDFEIEFEFKIEKGGNSGFYFRVGDKDNPVSKGIEVQISDSYKKGYTGPIKSDHACGGIIGGGGGPLKSAAKPAGEWNVFRITVKDNKLTVNLNGELVNELDMTQGKAASRPQTGWIGFQDHGLPLWLRNIKIREL